MKLYKNRLWNNGSRQLLGWLTVKSMLAFLVVLVAPGATYGGMWTDSSWWNGFFSRQYTMQSTTAELMMMKKNQEWANNEIILQNNAYLLSRPQREQIAKPPTPTMLMTSVSNYTATLTWARTRSGGQYARKYRLEISKYATFSTLTVGTVVSSNA